MSVASDAGLTIDGDVAQGGGAVVLDIGVGRVEERDKDWDGSSADQLLPVFVYHKLFSAISPT